ncbi:MAG: RluA family pseudouridine synthase [Terriglobales bacterium]
MLAAEAAGERLDRFLARQLTGTGLPNPSRMQIQHWIRGGAVSVGGETCRRAALRLRGGETVDVDTAVAADRAAGGDLDAGGTLAPVAVALDVVYEDADLAVVNKPAGLMVHPGAGGHGPTLAAALLRHFGAGGLSVGGGPERPGIVHRLDRDTSGLLVVAKNDWAHQRLAAQFQARQVRKRYLGLVHGAVAGDSGRVDLPVARDLRRRARMTTRRAAAPGRKDVREAHTRYRVLERWGAEPGQPARPGSRPRSDVGARPGNAASAIRYTYLEIEILTGRTHQIRVHMAALGHPIVGDRLYGAPAQLAGPGTLAGRELGRLFLHSALLGFTHPRTGAEMAFQAALPEELEAVLRSLRA